MAAPHINLVALMQQPFAKGIAHAAAASVTFMIGVAWVMKGAPIPHYGPLIGGSPKPVVNLIDAPTILGPNTPTWGIFGHPDTFCANRYFNPKSVAGATTVVVTHSEVTPTFNEQDKNICPSSASNYGGTTIPTIDSSTTTVDSIFIIPESASHLRPLLYLAVPFFFVWVLGKLISKAYNKLHQGGPVVVPPVVINIVRPIQPNREPALRRKFFYKWREILRLGQIDRLESRIRNLEREKKAKLEGRMSREQEIFERKLADRDILHQGRALRSQKEIDSLRNQKDDLQNQLDNREPYSTSRKELEANLEKKTELCATYKRLNESNLTTIERLQEEIDTNARQLAASRKELEADLEKKTELCATYKKLNESNLTTIERLQAEIDTNARQAKEDRETMDDTKIQHKQESHELQLEVTRLARELSGVKDQKLELDCRLQQAWKEKAELERRLGVTATSGDHDASGITSNATDAPTLQDTSAVTNGQDQSTPPKEWRQANFTTPKADFGAIAKGGDQKALPDNVFANLTAPSSKTNTAPPAGLLGSTTTTQSPAFDPNGTNIQLFKVPALALQPSNSGTNSPHFGSSTGAIGINFTAGRGITPGGLQSGLFGADQPPRSENECSFLSAENLPITPGSSQGRRRADGRPLTRRAGQNKRNANAATRAWGRQPGA